MVRDGGRALRLRLSERSSTGYRGVITHLYNFVRRGTMAVTTTAMLTPNRHLHTAQVERSRGQGLECVARFHRRRFSTQVSNPGPMQQTPGRPAILV